MTSSPYDDANEADVAEQQRPATYDADEAPPTPPAVSTEEANEADALEQGTEVGADDEDDYR
jgi:hypothetical protein